MNINKKKVKILGISAIIFGLIITFLWAYFKILELEEIGNYAIVFKTNMVYRLFFVLLSFGVFYLPLYISGKSVQKKLKMTFHKDFASLFQMINKIISFVISIFLLYNFYDDLHIKALLFLNSELFHEVAPLGNKDIGYFLFERPFLFTLTKMIFISFLMSFLYSVFMYFVGFEIYSIYLKRMAYTKTKFVLNKEFLKGSKIFKIKGETKGHLQLQQKQELQVRDEFQQIEPIQPNRKLQKTGNIFKKLYFMKDIQNFYTESKLNQITLNKILTVFYTMFDILKRNYRKILENEFVLKDLCIKLNIISFLLIFIYYFQENGLIYSEFLGLTGVGFTHYTYWTFANKTLMILTLLLVLLNIFLLKKSKLFVVVKFSLSSFLLPIVAVLLYFVFYLFSQKLDPMELNRKFIQYHIENTVKAYAIDSFYERADISVSIEDKELLEEYFSFKLEKKFEEIKLRDQVDPATAQKGILEKTQDLFGQYDEYTREVNESLKNLSELGKLTDTESVEELQRRSQEEMNKLIEKGYEVTNSVEDPIENMKVITPDFKTEFEHKFGDFDFIVAHKDLEKILREEIFFDNSLHRQYYMNFTFNPILIEKDGTKQIAILSPREQVFRNGIVSQYEIELQDTHGYGIDLLTLSGENIYRFQKDIGTSIDKNVDLKTEVMVPQIYYGKNIKQPAIINSKVRENDNYGKNFYSYAGKGGFELNPLNKILTSAYLKQISLLLNQNVYERSKILLNRDILKRAKKALPFLHIDEEPYMVITDEGRLKWIIDAYTVSDKYPFSNKSLVSPENNIKINYIRNSVRIVIDAYDGKLDAYTLDHQDPVLKVYKKAYPGIIHDEFIPQTISSHFHYPLKYLEIKFKIFEAYNKENRDVEVFYNKSNLKTVSNLTMEGEFRDHVFYAVLDVGNIGTKEFVTIVPIKKFNSAENTLNKAIIISNDIRAEEKIGIYSFQ
jgi:uncharacterized membrane protein (UPF0182 family)